MNSIICLFVNILKMLLNSFYINITTNISISKRFCQLKNNTKTSTLKKQAKFINVIICVYKRLDANIPINIIIIIIIIITLIYNYY